MTFLRFPGKVKLQPSLRTITSAYQLLHQPAFICSTNFPGMKKNKEKMYTYGVGSRKKKRKTIQFLSKSLNSWQELT